jgi:uncharacterized protein YaeQ
MEQFFNLEGCRTLLTAEQTLDNVTAKLNKVVQLKNLEVLSWTDGTIVYHGVTKITDRSVLLTVEKDGTIYARWIDGETAEVKLGKLYD